MELEDHTALKDGESFVTIQRVTGTSTHTGLAFGLRGAAPWKLWDGMKAAGARTE